VRRGGAPTLPVDPAAVPAFARVERGPRGLRLGPVPAPAGAAEGAAGALRLRAAAPAAVRRAEVVAGGRLVLAAGTGVAYSLAAPDMRVVHDRRPPGIDLVAGAAGANAGLLRADDGWRAVVLPSLGDIAADLGPGPAAIRADGRRVAALADGAIEERDVGADGVAARHEGVADALCYAPDGVLLAAAGARVGPPGAPARPGPAIVALAAAAAAPRVAALHEDGSVSVWEAGADEPLASWASPVDGAGAIGLSPDGALVALGAPEGADPAACLARAEDGAQVRRVEGARVIAPAPAEDGLVVAGDWGCAWLMPLELEEDG
jgi:hypothetical protein